MFWLNADGSMDYEVQRSCEAQEARGARGRRVEEGFWNPGGRRRGNRGELQGPCNHCFVEGVPAEDHELMGSAN